MALGLYRPAGEDQRRNEEAGDQSRPVDVALETEPEPEAEPYDRAEVALRPERLLAPELPYREQPDESADGDRVSTPERLPDQPGNLAGKPGDEVAEDPPAAPDEEFDQRPEAGEAGEVDRDLRPPVGLDQPGGNHAPDLALADQQG